MSSRRYELIVFDWDGTLFDSTQLIVRCIQAAARDMQAAVPSDQACAYVIGLGLMQALAQVAPDVPPEKLPQFRERYQYHYRIHHNDIGLFDGVLPMLHALKTRQYQLAVATGKSRVGLNEVLARDELQGMFGSSRTADETRSKPDPLMLWELMDERGVQPEQTLMIGDTTYDLHMAQGAGCASVAVSYGAHEWATFDEFGPLFVAHSVAQLHEGTSINTQPPRQPDRGPNR